MSQQGGRPAGHSDDWWGQLYDDSVEDTGPAPTPDSLDDRFASASDAVTGGPPAPPPRVPAPRGGQAPRPQPPAPSPEAPARSPDAPAPRPGVPALRPGVPAPRPESPVAPRPERPAPPPERPAPRPEGPAATQPERPAPQPGGPVPQPGGPASQPGGPASQPGGPASQPDGPIPQPTPAPRPPHGPTVSTTGSPAPPPPPPPPPSQPPSPDTSPPAPPTPTPLAYVGSGPPTYDPEPTALPAADPDDLGDLVPDTVLDGARYGTCTLRAVSVRGDSARYRGEPRRDALLTARFGTGDQALLLVAMATGARATPRAHRAAAEVCQWIGRAVGRSHARLAEDIRAGRRGDLKSGLHRLTDRSLGKLRAGAADQGLRPEEYAATLRCLLLPADPQCRTRVFFGVGAGGLFRLRDGGWQDIEPQVVEAAGEPVVGFGSPPSETPEGDRLTMDLGIPTPPSPFEPAPEPPREPFRFRASVARPGDVLLMCTAGLAEPLRGEPELPAHLTERWSHPEPPGLAAFLADTQLRVKGYADDRTAAAVWEA
ncbi:protein phosphatase 2C domain-containing protein [Streptomyces sp. NPDC052773]|uniref:protein phosphatase 2C domain-containing protein n=1 Tax=Streptomyces sp. NPDC052773 TaxID=3365693 RepID=UPI0037D94780